jgi:ubiquitin-like 1-activating enzyme E1 B
VNTQQAKLKDIMEKSVKANMSVNSPLIMHGSTLLFESGDDIEELLLTQIFNI